MSPEKETPKGSGVAHIVPVRSIRVSKERARKDFSGIPKLMDSIRAHGLLHPLVVARTQTAEGKEVFDLLAGESRYRAIVLLGWTEVAVQYHDELSTLEKKEIELEENLRRKNLDWQEEIEAMRQIDDLKRSKHGSATQGKAGEGWSIAKTAELAGVSPTQAQRQIAFAKKLQARPELKEAMKGMPLKVAMRVVEQREEAERVKRLAESGQIKLDTTLLNLDCLEGLRDLKDSSVDLVVTDPPFGITTLTEMEGKSRGTIQSYTTLLQPDDNSSEEEVKTLMSLLAPELSRVLKPGSHLYVFFGFELYEHLYWTFLKAGILLNRTPLIWDKGRTTSPFRGYEYSPCYEPIFHGFKLPQSRRLTEAGKTIIQVSPDSAGDKIHPFQKPLALLCYFIQQSSNHGDLVLDPFAGSGMTLLAAKMLGRRALGYEKSKDHFDKAQALLTKGQTKT